MKLLHKAVILSNILHMAWLILFCAYIFTFIELENMFLERYFWFITPIYGMIISIFALKKKVAQVPAIMSIIFSISTLLLWSIVIGINQF